MTTKEFINMLQKADPSGDAHVRLEGGVPIFAEHKPGYYDGPYTYINKEGKYVTSIKDSKVDIVCVEPFDLLLDELEWNSYVENEEACFEQAYKLFDFEFDGYSESSKQDRIASFYKSIDENINSFISIRKKHDSENLNKVIKQYNEGWRYFQKVGENKWYDWNIIDPKSKREGANLAISKPILMSDKFYPTEEVDGCIEWKLKN